MWAKGWPTPRANQAMAAEFTPEAVAKAPEGVKTYPNLESVVSVWPTPRVSSVNGPSQKEIAEGNPKRRLETEVACGHPPQTTCTHGEKCRPCLNPRFVASLMGFPPGWREIDDEP